MNKKVMVFAAFVLIGLSMISFASAYYFPSARQVSESVITTYVDVFEPFLRALLGGNDWTGLLLFEKLLLFILLMAVIYAATGNLSLFEEHKAVRWAISIIVPLIGVRYMNYDWVNTVITQYQVVAIAITSLLPFMVYFVFLHNGIDSSMFRRVGWLLFILVYLGLWTTTESEGTSAIYFWTLIAAVVFAWFDGTIHGWYAKWRMRGAGKATLYMGIARLKKDIDDVNAAVASGHMDLAVANNIIKQKKKDIAFILKQTK